MRAAIGRLKHSSSTKPGAGAGRRRRRRRTPAAAFCAWSDPRSSGCASRWSVSAIRRCKCCKASRQGSGTDQLAQGSSFAHPPPAIACSQDVFQLRCLQLQRKRLGRRSGRGLHHRERPGAPAQNQCTEGCRGCSPGRRERHPNRHCGCISLAPLGCCAAHAGSLNCGAHILDRSSGQAPRRQGSSASPTATVLPDAQGR